jgi:ATP-binding cassette subfamily B protein
MVETPEPVDEGSQWHDLWHQLQLLPRTLQLVWEPAPHWTAAWIVLLLVQGVLPAIAVSLTRLLVDRLVAAIDAGGTWASMQSLLLPGFWMAGTLLFTEIVQGTIEWIDSAQTEIVQDRISALVHDRSVNADLAFFESSDYRDSQHQASTDLSQRPLDLLQSLGELLQNSVTLLAMVGILLPYGIGLPLVLVLGMVPALAIAVVFNRYHHRWWERTTADRRWADYYDRLVQDETVAAELRLFDLGPHFQMAYQTLRTRLRGAELRLLRDRNLARLAAQTTAFLTSGGAIVWTIWRALQGLLTLGDLALFYQAFNKGQGLMRSLLGNLDEIYRNTLYLENLFDFLDRQPKTVDPPYPRPVPSPPVQGIRFRQVTFCYPGSREAALQDFNLTLPAGQCTALVGDNGAGKSTLVKLLCRLYDPQVGTIELDGIDLRHFSVAELRRQISVLFQFPVRYHATVTRNIALGNLAAEPTLAEIETAVHRAGIRDLVAHLPDGYDTLLGKSFAGGTDLSGGEWQRLALARAFLRQSPIVILDEPTSAMDSWAEMEWLQRFRTLVAGRTAIIITHRLTTAMQADAIHVMREGRVVESGSHSELLARRGLYARAWSGQMLPPPET